MEGLQLLAGGDINPARFVTLSTTANNTVVESNAGDTKIVGISQEGTRDAPVSGASTLAAASGDSLRVHVPGEVCYLDIDSAGCTAGDFLKPDNAGEGDVAGAADVAAAIALETVAANEKCRVLVLGPHSIPA